MVAEVQCEDGIWESFITDPFPLHLADEIKQEQAIEYLPNPRPDQDDHLFAHKELPFSPPMTHQLHGFPIIAKYPLEEWKRSHRPGLMVKGWYKLAMIISTRGMCNIQCCFEVAGGDQDKVPPQPTEYVSDWSPHYYREVQPRRLAFRPEAASSRQTGSS